MKHRAFVGLSVSLFAATLILGLAPAHAVGGHPACVGLGIGRLVVTRCDVPEGSLLYVPAKDVPCEIPGIGIVGEVHFYEAEPGTIPRLPIAPAEWSDIKALNDFYRDHASDYGGQVRFFWRICQDDTSNSRTPINPRPEAVPITDPLLDIRFDVESLSLSLPLPAVTLSTLPEPGVFFGLKVNNPAWFAVTPDSWQSVSRGPLALRGWLVTLNVRPVSMTFTITQGGTKTTVPCDPAAQRYVASSTRFPTEPDDFTAKPNWLDPPDDPLPTRACVWTPRRKGAGTAAAAVTYEVTATAGGFLFRFTPRVSTTNTAIEVNELRVVNVKP